MNGVALYYKEHSDKPFKYNKKVNKGDQYEIECS
jgi:hypothetical protein